MDLKEKNFFQRYTQEFIKKDSKDKIILVSGPRQVGKTTLAFHLSQDFQYLNYDNDEHKLLIKSKQWDRDKEFLILDELHKMNQWKTWLKGVYDVEGVQPRIIVTGSARLETYTNVGDSLAGRFFSFRIHPLDLWELAKNQSQFNSEETLDDLIRYSGFPEPFFKKSDRFYRRWSKTHLDTILREDFLGLVQIGDIQKLKLLIELLRTRVGSPLSYSSLARDMGCSYKTVQRWVGLLEKLYIVFKISPYHQKVSRSIIKTPKFYFFNTAYVEGHHGIKFENLVANALLKKLHYLEDVEGEKTSLHYLKNKNGKEVDFLVLAGERTTMIETKWSDSGFSRELMNFKVPGLTNIQRIQLVKECLANKSTPDGSKLFKASQWLLKTEV